MWAASGFRKSSRFGAGKLELNFWLSHLQVSCPWREDGECYGLRCDTPCPTPHSPPTRIHRSALRWKYSKTGLEEVITFYRANEDEVLITALELKGVLPSSPPCENPAGSPPPWKGTLHAYNSRTVAKDFQPPGREKQIPLYNPPSLQCFIVATQTE